MGEQQFVLRWHYQETTLLKNLSTFLDSDTLTDITLSVESQQIRAHKLILAMCSVYFFQLFQEINETQHLVIVLHNAALEDVKAILNFIYRGQCVVSKRQLPSLLAVARSLKIQGLCDMPVPECNIENDNGENDVDESTPTPEKKIETFPPNQLRHDEFDAAAPKKSPKELSETCKCFLCGKYLSNQYNLRVHMETHEETYHACQSCPHVSRSRDALRKHVSYRHPEQYHNRKRKKTT